MTVLWMRKDKDLNEHERAWMSRLSRIRVHRFGRIPEDSDEWQRQMAEIAASIKAERGR